MFMLLSAVLHLGDLRFTALTDVDTAFPSDLQLLERGQCPTHTTTVTCMKAGNARQHFVPARPPAKSRTVTCLSRLKHNCGEDRLLSKPTHFPTTGGQCLPLFAASLIMQPLHVLL